MKTIATFVLLTCLSSLGYAKTLFKYSDKKITPKLAKSFEKVEDLKFKVTIDSTKKVQGKPITIDFVKQSLEGKLQRKLAVEVSQIDDSSAFITFKGNEETFLKRVSKTRIKARKSISLAMETKASDGGIRAKTGKDPADDDQIKLKILRVNKTAVEGIVTGIGKDYKGKFKIGRRVKLRTTTPLKFKKGSTQFLSPEKKKIEIVDWVLP